MFAPSGIPRVAVFIDGQNVFMTCKRLFGSGYCHPLLIARRLAGDRDLRAVRYYSGVHDPRKNSVANRISQRRHDLMRASA